MTRKGVWNLQQVRDKYLQELWAQRTGAWSWGNNNMGQLGHNDKTQRSSPVQIGSNDEGWQISGADQASAYTSATYTSFFVIKDDNTLWSWGSNYFGSGGINLAPANGKRSSPVQIPGTTWKSLGGGKYSMSAIKTDGTLWSWGYNDKGELGLNNLTRYSSPVQVPGTTWSSVSGGDHTRIARKTDGTLWTWGLNEAGALGDGTTTQRSSPVQVPGTSWTDNIAACQLSNFAIKSDNTMWGWGFNYEGALGQNNRTNYSSPKQIPGTTWKLLVKPGGTGNSRSFMAIKTDGTLWVTGSNTKGGLGQNSPETSHRSSPVQVPGTWSTTIRPSQAKYGRWAVAIKDDNTLWGWGNNNEGFLGQNDVVDRSSPVQIPGMWVDVQAGGSSSTFAIRQTLTPSQL